MATPVAKPAWVAGVAAAFIVVVLDNPIPWMLRFVEHHPTFIGLGLGVAFGLPVYLWGGEPEDDDPPPRRRSPIFPWLP